MIEIRYRVVNKYLTEIRDIDVKESSSNGKTGSVTVTNPLHCKAGEYLNTNLVFYDDSFNRSLNSGLLKSYLMSGAVKQVWYDTELEREIDNPNGFVPQKQNQDNSANELAQMFKEAGITKDDLKDIVSLLKEKKQAKQETENQPIQKEVVKETEKEIEERFSKDYNNEPYVDNSGDMPQVTIAKTQKTKKSRAKVVKPVDNPVDNSVKKVPKKTSVKQKNIEKSNESSTVNKLESIVVNNLETEKNKINTFNYQQRLEYIKQCNDLDILKWIQSQFHQVAIFNAVSNKINELTTKK